MYVIVKFHEKNEIAVVPKLWFREEDSTCAWPPFKDGRLTRAVQRAEEHQNQWPWLDATVLKNYVTYEEARGNLNKIAEARTDDSEGENTQSNKRRRFVPRRFQFENSGDESSQNETSDGSAFNGSLNPPDLSLYIDSGHLTSDGNEEIPSPGQNVVALLSPGGSSYGVDITTVGSQPFSPQTVYTATPSRGSNTGHLTSDGNEEISSPSQNLVALVSAGGSSYGVDTTTVGSQPFSPQTVYSATPSRGSNTEFEKAVIEHLTTLNEKVDQINRKIEKLLKVSTSFPDDRGNEEYPWTTKLPLANYQDLMELDTAVRDNPRARDCLVSTLAEVGGNDCKSSTRFMMKKLIKYEVAAQFSWIGQKGKMKFSDLEFPSVVFKALKLNRATKANANEKDVKDHIMDFLKHSAEKLLSRRRPAEHLFTHPQTTGSSIPVLDEQSQQ